MILLLQDELHTLFDYCPETGLLTRKMCTANRHTIGELVGTSGSRGYLQATIHSRKYPVHRIIWCWLYGAWPKHDVDHINRVRNDNRKINLREVTRSENNHNGGANRRNTSGHRGASWDKSKQLWVSHIRAYGVSYFLGRHKTAELASAAYYAAKAIHHPTYPGENT